MHSNEICNKLRILLDESVKKNLTDGILLSGGLDTSILAAIASGYAKLNAFTIGFKGFNAPDIEYSKLISRQFNLHHIIYQFDEEELYDAISCTIKITKSFDPMEIRNSAVIFIGLRLAKEYGIRSIMTGDGSDELFAGYSFLFGYTGNELNERLEKLWNSMQFSSVGIGRALGIIVRLPYLDTKFKKFATKIDSKLKIETENGNIYGKWILRKAFENLLPREITWRTKTPIESGSGTVILPKFFNEKISDTEFIEKKHEYKREGVNIRDKEHLYCYEIYRDTFGEIPIPKEDEIECFGCSGGMSLNTSYCRICGYTKL